MKQTLFLFLALFLALGGASLGAQKITLTAVMMAGDIPEETQAFLDQFSKENPNIKIDFTNVPQDLEAFPLVDAEGHFL